MLKPIFLLVLAALAEAPAAAQTGRSAEEQNLLTIRVLDAKVATIGHRLAVSGTGLCPVRQWLPGFAVHDISQYGGPYREAAIHAFGLGRGPGVLAVAADGPAEEAGLRQDDILVSADGARLTAGESRGTRTFDAVAVILDALDRAFSDGRARLAVLRGSEQVSVEVEAEQGCATRFQLIPSSRLNALADGRYVQVTTAIAQYVVDDQELAAVLAHEFAHNILGHRVRLDQAGVHRGFLGNFGRNARLIRETEAEADRFSIYLLDRAGYDPEAALRFWTRFGRRGLSFLDSPNHPRWRERVELMRAEVENVRRARAAGNRAVPTFVRIPAAAAPTPSG